MLRLLSLLLFFPLYGELSLETKVGQVFIGIILGDHMDESAEAFLEKTKLGNLLFFEWANGLKSPSRITHLTQEAHAFIEKNTGISPLLAIDQEGGRVNRLPTRYPAPISYTSVEEVREFHSAMGKEALGLGFNLLLAPVVDIGTNPHNPIMKDRIFGTTAKEVIEKGKAALDGFHDSPIATTLKHFPGHGDAASDSHTGLPIVDKTLCELEEQEFRPFKELAPFTDLVMTVHLLLPSIDSQVATFSPFLLKHILREQWKFQGVIISDSLVMRAASPRQTSFEEAIESVSEAAIQAFNAGCDLLMLSRLEWADFRTTPEQDYALMEAVMERFTEAVKNGDISEERLNQSVERILRLKLSLSLKL